MSPLQRQILSTSLRAGLRSFQSNPTAPRRFVSTAPRAPAYWGKAVKNAGGTALLYFPIVGVVMFWPYAVKPVMDASEGVKRKSKVVEDL